MQERSGFPYAELVFDKTAAVIERESFDELLASGAGTVIVLAHGWNNDMKEACELFDALAQQLRTQLGDARHAAVAGAAPSLLGVLWPSKRFAEQSLIPGGAASAGSQASEAALLAELDSLAGVFDAPGADERLDQAKALVGRLDDSPKARDAFAELVRGVLPAGGEDVDDAAPQFRSLKGREALARLSAPVLETRPARRGGAAAVPGPNGSPGSAAGLSFSGFKAGALRLVNLTTYYQMKERSGRVGLALSEPLRALHEAGMKLHLVGHSFGGRLQTAAAVGAPGADPLPVASLCLLQAAFSHYGFAKDYEPGQDGFFRRLVTDSLVTGPVLITHSRHDVAVGYAYPLASRLARQSASFLGDAGDRFGGIGRNGAQKTPEATPGELLPAGEDYALTNGALRNLNADKVIEDHGDIRGPEVANAILSAIAAAP